MELIDTVYISSLPSLDLHGYDRDSARMATNDFIEENIILENDTIVIIHGIGQGIVKNEVHSLLKNHKKVIEYKTDNFNSGCTIIKLNIGK